MISSCTYHISVHLTLTSFSRFTGQCLVFIVRPVSEELLALGDLYLVFEMIKS